MNKTVIGVLIAATTMGSAAFAQASHDPTWAPPAMPEPPPPPQAPAAAGYAYAAPLPAAPAAVPYAYAATAPVAPPAPAGQWVHTHQYGWLWMPYGPSYTYVAGPHLAYTFAYYPRRGWHWVAAPWVLQVGPTPYWGRLGPSRFAWYGNPGFRRHRNDRGGWRARPEHGARTPYVVSRDNVVRTARHHHR